jgi:hypothetical protein
MSEDISTNFIFIIDGEVALSMPLRIDPTMPESIKNIQEKFLAVLQSNPTIVESSEPITEGSTWDGQNFILPVE